ncbi:MAG TPA: hypothetical protein VIL38_05025 [Thermaerobacter sp.]
MRAPDPGAGPGGVRPHLLAVRSVVFGTCNLLLLGVPAGWRLGDGAFPPEVDRWQVRDGISWATAGRGHWWLASRDGAGGDAAPRARVRAELFLSVVPAAPAGRGAVGAGTPPAAAQGLRRVAARGALELAGHRGWWAKGAVRRGFPGRWRPARTLVLDCGATGRQLQLRLEAAAGCPEEELETAWQAILAAWRCH